ncbi:MAG: hypothetical protein ABI467_18985 [Kofleriaceae bacterium]
MLRTTLLITLLAACAPDVAHDAPTNFATAVFDPTTSQIPLPNDLAFTNPLNTLCGDPTDTTSAPAKCAQAELLGSFAGKFPSDQAVAITIDFTQTTFDDKGQTTNTAPDLDLTSFTPDKFFVYGISGGAQGEAALEPLTAASYVKGMTKGTLTIHHKGFAPWAGGSYVAVVRGGPDGVKTKDGSPIYASQVFSLIEQGQDMTDPANLGLLKAQYGTQQALALGAQLNQVITLYKGTAFPIADLKFPHQQLAIALTFTTQPEVTNVSIDPARGLVPLPIDLLRDPASGHLTDQAACAFLSTPLDASGKCTSAAAAGFLALDGFATTGAILAPTSELIEAKTIDANSLRLYDLSDKDHPVQVPASALILEPCEFTSGCGAANPLSPVIAIQPAGASAGDPASVFLSKPLKDNTDYAVVMTTDIKDKAGNPIGAGTVAKIVRFKNPIAVAGKSQLVGIADTTAQQLENMRLLLAPLLGELATAGLDSAHLGMAYTFHTQSIFDTAVKLGALPYTQPATTANTSTVTALTPTAAFAKYGVDPTLVPGTGVGDHINEILEVDITTFNLLNELTGAFNSDPSMAAPETIHVLIATPKPGAVPACTGTLAPFGKCAPLMVFRHGLGGGRADMLTVADGFTAKGMVVVAIDAAKHGDRSFCTPGSATTNIPGFAAPQCAPANTCVTGLPAGAQGDAEPPGKCVLASDMTTPGTFQYRAVSSTCNAPGACGGYAFAAGIPFDSSNYLVTSNFFRTRDTFRQDFIDESQLVRAIAYVPTGLPPTGHNLFDYMITTAAEGFIINPATIYYSGQSLGSIQGVGDVATNPRISKAAFNVGGGTVVDIFTNSPAFVASTLALLDSLGVQPGTSAYLQFLVVAKTVLDPADPVNYAGHLTEHTLPNLLADQTGATPQAAKKVLAQVAFCDQTVPNPFGFILANNFNTVGPLPIASGFGSGTGTFSLFWNITTGGAPTGPKLAACTTGSTPGAVEHGFVTDWKDPLITSTAQSDIASFVTSDTNPPSIQALP